MSTLSLQAVERQFNPRTFRTTVIGTPMTITWLPNKRWDIKSAVGFVAEKCSAEPTTPALRSVHELVAAELSPFDTTRVKFHCALGTPMGFHQVDGVFTFEGVFVTVEATMDTVIAGSRGADVRITPNIFEPVPNSPFRSVLRLNEREVGRVADAVVACFRPRIRAAQKSFVCQKRRDEERAERAGRELKCLLLS